MGQEQLHSGMAASGMAKDDGKQLLAKQAIPELTADATRHLRVPKGLFGAGPSQLLLGREEGAFGGPYPPNHNRTGLNALVGSWQGGHPGTTCWQGGHPPASKPSAVGELGTKPRCLSPSCWGPSHGAISRKSQGMER